MKFFKALGVMVGAYLKIFLSCLFNAWLAILLVNPAFHLTIGFWAWVGVVFVAIEVCSSATGLLNSNKK